MVHVKKNLKKQQRLIEHPLNIKSTAVSEQNKPLPTENAYSSRGRSMIKSKKAKCIGYCVRLSHFSHVKLFATLWIVACQAPLPMGILQARILEWVAMPSSRGS